MIFFQADVCLLRASACFLPLKTLNKISDMLPDMTLDKNEAFASHFNNPVLESSLKQF